MPNGNVLWSCDNCERTAEVSCVFATEKFIQNVTIDGIMMDCTGVERI